VPKPSYGPACERERWQSWPRRRPYSTGAWAYSSRAVVLPVRPDCGQHRRFATDLVSRPKFTPGRNEHFDTDWLALGDTLGGVVGGSKDFPRTSTLDDGCGRRCSRVLRVASTLAVAGQARSRLASSVVVRLLCPPARAWCPGASSTSCVQARNHERLRARLAAFSRRRVDHEAGPLHHSHHRSRARPALL